MENNKFNIYGDYLCKLQSGKNIKLERTINHNLNNIQEDLEEALNSDFKSKLVELQEEEKEKFNFLKEHLDDWQKVAEKVKILQLAQKYEEDCKKVEDLETTHNEWKESKDYRTTRYDISNKSYKMFISVYEDSYYQNGKDIPCRWQVNYWVQTNSITNESARTGEIIASVDRKVFTDKDKAYSYIEGRKKFFSKYFKEEYQPLRKEDVVFFESCGRLIKGYSIEV